MMPQALLIGTRDQLVDACIQEHGDADAKHVLDILAKLILLIARFRKTTGDVDEHC